MKKSKLVESFEKHLAIFGALASAAIPGISEVLESATDKEKQEMIEILKTVEKDKVRVLSLLADRTISDIALQALKPEVIRNDQIIIDYLFSVMKNPSPFLISKVTAGYPKHQNQLGKILLNCDKYSDEQVSAAISRCTVQTLALIQKTIEKTKFKTMVNERIKQLLIQQ